MKNNKFGLLTYPATPYYNVGDYIQSLAAKQYLPQVNQLVEREKLKSYSGEDINMIMNSWYIYNNEEFPPSEKINPLFVSFHLNSSVKDAVLKNPKTIEYFKNYGRVGCRDLYTLKSLQDVGVDAYFSGCLTTTLDIKYKFEGERSGVVLADPLFLLPNWDILTYNYKFLIKGALRGDLFRLNERKKLLKKLISPGILESTPNLHHKLPGSHSEEQRFKEAERFLNTFAKAKLVVTSRIHCALPCLALGTPVIFINYGFSNASDQSRFKGITDLFNTITIDEKGNVQSNFGFKDGDLIDEFTIDSNPEAYKKYADDLKAKCFDFVDSSI